MTSSNAGISVPGNIANLLQGDFTIGFRIYMTGKGQQYCSLIFRVGYDVNPYPGPNFWFDPDAQIGGKNCIYFRLKEGDGFASTSTATSLTNKRVHLCWTRKNGLNKCFINGVLENSYTSNTGTSNGNMGYILSRYSSTQSLATGSMGSEFIIEDKGREDNEVLKYVNKTKKKYGLS